jgi:hypothetical protein
MMMYFINNIKSKIIQLKIFQMILNVGYRNKSLKLNEFQDDDKYELIYKPNKATYSGHYLKIIPSNPFFEPSKQQQFNAIQLLISLFVNNEIKTLLTKKIEFVDQGENFDSVSCNLCGALIDSEEWSVAVENALSDSFNNLSFQTPCCGLVSNLNELNYDMPAGFSKYQMIITDPEYEDYSQNEKILNLQTILGVQVKLIWCHY